MATSEEPEQFDQPTAPLDVDGVSAMTVGTVLWAVAFVVLLISGTTFSSDNSMWLWVCIAGLGLGILFMAYTRRRRAVYQAAAAQADQES